MSSTWSHTAGPHGAKVTVEERRRGGNVYLKAYDPEIGGYRKRSLKFSVRDEDGKLIDEAKERAKAAAGELSNRRLQGEQPWKHTRLDDLFKRFKRDVFPDLDERYQNELERAMTFWKNFLGSDFRIDEDFTRRHWKSARRERASGRRNARGELIRKEIHRTEVRARTVQKTMRALRRICRWGKDERLPGGGFLLDHDPTRGLEMPSEDNPRRPVMSDERYATMLEKAGEHEMAKGDEKVRSYIREILTIVGETGRRISAVLALRWDDWRPDEGTYGELRWRAEEDKIGREWTTPVTPAVRQALQTQRQRFPGVGQAHVFPAPASDGPLRKGVARKWFVEVEGIAELDHIDGLGFHGLRRRWASKRKHMSAKDVAAVGGWTNTQTLKELYQFPDRETMEEVAMGGRDLGAVEGG